jgi:AcrR family transcriptional regulator
MPRRYELKRRAERQRETRRRIIEAAIDLHAAGPASVSAIAARAGVGRVTVYRHFPDEHSLVIACTTAYFDARPFPDPAAWVEIADPEARLRHGLGELYAYYADNEPLLASAASNMAAHPSLAEALRPLLETLDRMRQVLSIGWGDDEEPRSLVAAAIGHAVDYLTWRSLTRVQGLSQPEAVELMLALVSGLRSATLRQVPPPGQGRRRAVSPRSAN